MFWAYFGILFVSMMFGVAVIILHEVLDNAFGQMLALLVALLGGATVLSMLDAINIIGRLTTSQH